MKIHTKQFIIITVMICASLLVISFALGNLNTKADPQSMASQPTKNTLSSKPPVSSSIQNKELLKPTKKEKIPNSFLKLQNKYQLVAIPTYDGSYQLTHPKILYFDHGWNGYKYWMSMTPYPHGKDVYENPSIVVSNDGNTWFTPDGLKNPVSGIPKDKKSGGHYSDPHLVLCGDTMELWYRYNPALANKAKRRRPDNSINIYYRKTSKDGIHWTKAQKLLQSHDGHLSLCINFENGVYNTWYATYDGKLYYSKSMNATEWSSPVQCFVPLPKGLQPYHQDIIQNGSKYYLLQTAEKTANYTFQLFLLTSDDGVHFSGTQQIYPNNNKALWKDVSFYRSTFFVKDNKLNLYISLIIPRLKWYITKAILPLP